MRSRSEQMLLLLIGGLAAVMIVGTIATPPIVYTEPVSSETPLVISEQDHELISSPEPSQFTKTLLSEIEDTLEAIRIAGRAPKTGYARDLFGNGWKDPDRNGCDARNDTLDRDLTDVVKDGPCKVISGTLVDPFTGEQINFVRGQGTSTKVHIDHVVSLSDAWQKGAQQWDDETRLLFANDPINLLAVDGPTNNSKGNSDAATWLPPNRDFRCQYVATQILVKAKYQLWITQAEKEAMLRILQSDNTGCELVRHK